MNYFLRFLILFVGFISFTSLKSFAQTTLIDPTGAGGFELGADMASNGWTSVNAATDGWFVGNAPVVATGNNCGFVSTTGGVGWAYSQISVFNHIYRDITIPANESKVTLSFKWKAGGEGGTTSDWDNMKVFLASTTTVPTSTAAVTGATQLSGPGAVSGMYKLNSAAWNNETITFSGLPGTTYRLIFQWKSDGSDIVNPPAALDDISVVTSLPGIFISIITGNWNDPLTWDANAVPSAADNATVSATHIVTVNATGQAINNLIVNGTLAYATTPTQFNVNGNLTVNNGGLVNAFFNTTGKTLIVSGNIINNGRIDISVGTTTAGNLTLNGSTVQSVTGSGTFGGTVSSTTTTNTVGVIRNLTCSNTNTTIPNIIWAFNNVRIAYNLNLTGAKIDLGSNTIHFGNYTTANTLTAPVGTGFLSGTYSRYWSALQTGTGITTGVNPTNTTSRYPFLSPTATNRAMYISRTGGTTGSTAGYLAVNFSNDDNNTTGLSIDDAGYTITDRNEGTWTVSSSDGYGHNNGHTAVILAAGVFSPLNGNSRIMLANAPAGGTHQAGTVTPGAQRVGMSLADLTASPLHIGIGNADNQYPCAGTPLIPTINTSALSLCQGVNDTLTATGLAVNTLGLSYQWQISSTSGGGYTNISGATNATAILNSQLSPGANYIVLKTNCSNSLDSSYSNEIVLNVNGGTITPSPSNFCGVGGLATLEMTASSAYDSIVWSSLTPSGTITEFADDSVGFNVQQTSEYSATIYFTSGSACPIYGSLGVYPLPNATVTTSANGVCPGTSATINSGLSAGNFISQSITHAPRIAPSNAVTLVTGGVASPAVSTGGLDDGGWNNIPVGFNFNFFGTSYNSITIGTNGTLFFGGGNVADFAFTTLPSTTEPFNMVAVLAMDNNLVSADGGTIKYWTEGFAPNRKFVVSYDNVKEFGDTKYSTAQAIFFETTGYVEVHVTSSTNVDRNKLVGINNGNGTVGVLAFASGTTASATNPIINPFAYRFIPPNDYATVWSSSDANGSTVVSDSINEFSLSVSPQITTIYNISYTNLTTGCSNAPNSAQVTMSVLGQIAPTGVLASASADSICFGESVTLTTDYTGSTDGLQFQWQVSADGVNFIDAFGQDQLTFTSNQTSNTTYRLKITSCGGTPSYSSNVLVSMGSCYLMTNGSISVCDGILYDTGGETGDYSSNEFYTLTLTPSTPGSLMQINFTSFQLETCCDDLTIYNGNSTASPIIGTYTSNPGSITSTAPDGSLTIVFSADGSVEFGGWSAIMACVLPPSNDSTCNAITIVADGSLNSFNNGGASVQLGEIAIAPPVTNNQDIAGWGDNALSATTWYKFIAPASGQIKLLGSDVEFDGQIAIYNVGSCSDFSTFNVIAANDNSIIDTSLAPGFTYCGLNSGTEYYIMHDSRVNTQTGEFSIRLSNLTVSAGDITDVLNVCTGESIDLFDGLTSEDNGGSWTQSTPTLGLNGSTFNSSGLAYQNFDFTYTVVDGCAADSELVTVKIFGPSNAGNGGALTACKNEPFNLLNGLTGTVDLGGTWYNPQNQALSSSIDTAGNFPGQFNYDYIVSNGVCPADTANILVSVDASCDYLVGLEELASTIQVFPNPTNGIFDVRISKQMNAGYISIEDINGKIIRRNTTLTYGSNQVDISDVMNGIYILRIKVDSSEFITRVVKN